MNEFVDIKSVVVSGETVKRAMITAGIQNVFDACSNCDHPVSFSRTGINIRRDTRCHCDAPGYKAETWDSVAACINKQTNERIKQNLMWAFGLSLSDYLPRHRS